MNAANQPLRERIEWLDIWIADGDATTLPRVLLIGDSIARGYRDETARQLADRASVSRLSTSKSLGDCALLAETELVLRGYSWDIIHFNNGLHGFGYTEAEYAAALPEWLSLMCRLAPKAHLIWATTTAMREQANLADFAPWNARVIKRNGIVAPIVSEQRIPIDDLYAISAANPAYYAADGVHFNPDGASSLAVSVAAAVTSVLKGQ